MKLITLTPKKSLSKAFLKQRPTRSEIDLFKKSLISLIESVNKDELDTRSESEEHLKTYLRDFLNDSFYKDSHLINTKDRIDLVIHSGKSASDFAKTNLKYSILVTPGKRFALEIVDKKKAADISREKQKSIKDIWKEAFDKAISKGKSISESQREAVEAVVAEYGDVFKFYETTDNLHESFKEVKKR